MPAWGPCNASHTDPLPVVAELRPFRGLRYDQAAVGGLGRVLAPPYDVISPEARDELYAASPYNVVRLEYARPEEGRSPYQAAAAALEAWRRGGILRSDPSPAFYLVRHRFLYAGRSWERRELIAALGLMPWTDGAVRPHEDTHAGPKADRLALMVACRANVSPIMALYRDPAGAVSRLLDEAARGEPMARAEGPPGESFDLWLVEDPDLLRAVQQALPGPLYVADGHHRYETALAYRELAAPPQDGRPRAADYVLAGLIALEDPGLLCLPYHRLLGPLPGEALAHLEGQVASLFDAERVPIAGLAPAQVAEIFARRVAAGPRPLLGMVGRGSEALRLLRPRDSAALAPLMPGRSLAWRGLSPCLFAEALLRPALGLSQQEAEALGLLTYPRDAAEAVAEVRAGRRDLALLLDGVPLDALTAAADAGERLPPKSTYFHPKLATGLVLYPLENGPDTR